MGQFLVAKLTGFRADVIDGSDELKELFRCFQCSAFNATMSVIACLQDVEKFYVNYIFRENRKKSEMIWTRIVDFNKSYSFPLEVDSFAKKRRQIVTLRKRTREGNFETGDSLGISTLASHYLGDSSLSQDVAMFDFSQSVVNMSAALSTQNDRQEGQGVHKEEDTDNPNSNAVFLDAEDLNGHECMGTLLALIDHMRESDIYKIPSAGISPESLPAWMESLVGKLNDDSSGRNVRLFILKIIANRPDTFSSFANLLGRDVLVALTDDELWGEDAGEVNTLQLDLTALLLSWSESYVPSTMRNAATSFVVRLVSAAYRQTNREVLKYLVEMVRTAATAWGRECIKAPTRKLYEGLIGDHRTASVSVQIVGILVRSAILPASLESCEESDVDKLFSALVSKLDGNTKQYYEQASEVLGMALRLYMEKEKPLGQKLETLVVEKFSKLCAKSSTVDDRERFISGLYHCSKNHPAVVEPFARKFMYTMRAESSIAMPQCLDMLTSWPVLLTESENGLSKELGMINMAELLGSGNSHECRLSALRLLEAVLPSCKDESVVQKYLLVVYDCCCDEEADSAEVRLAACVLAQKCHDREGSKSILCRCLGDADSSVSASARSFLDGALPSTSAPERLAGVVEVVANSDGQDSLLVCATEVMLALAERSPQAEEMMFVDPLTDSCNFKVRFLDSHKNSFEMSIVNARFFSQDQVIDTSWRSQTHVDSTPKYVETLTSNSQAWSQSQGAHDVIGFLRATQDHREFEETQQQATQATVMSTTQGSTQSMMSSQWDSGTQSQDQRLWSQGGADKSGSSLWVGKRFKRASEPTSSRQREKVCASLYQHLQIFEVDAKMFSSFLLLLAVFRCSQSSPQYLESSPINSGAPREHNYPY